MFPTLIVRHKWSRLGWMITNATDGLIDWLLNTRKAWVAVVRVNQDGSQQVICHVQPTTATER